MKGMDKTERPVMKGHDNQLDGGSHDDEKTVLADDVRSQPCGDTSPPHT